MDKQKNDSKPPTINIDSIINYAKDGNFEPLILGSDKSVSLENLAKILGISQTQYRKFYDRAKYYIDTEEYEKTIELIVKAKLSVERKRANRLFLNFIENVVKTIIENKENEIPENMLKLMEYLIPYLKQK